MESQARRLARYAAVDSTQNGAVPNTELACHNLAARHGALIMNVGVCGFHELFHFPPYQWLRLDDRRILPELEAIIVDASAICRHRTKLGGLRWVSRLRLTGVRAGII